jgi:hypothetical protein
VHKLVRQYACKEQQRGNNTPKPGHSRSYRRVYLGEVVVGKRKHDKREYDKPAYIYADGYAKDSSKLNTHGTCHPFHPLQRECSGGMHRISGLNACYDLVPL